FLDVYRREQRLAAVYKELIMFGVSAVYLLFTLSRTGYLAVLVMSVVMIPVLCFSMRKRWRGMLYSIGMMLLAAVVCFPVVFTAQRMVPAVVARPQLHEIEELPVEIVHGRDMDSYYYITIQRFIQVFQMKVLGIPEEESLRAIYMVADAKEELSRDPYVLEGEVILLASLRDTASGAENLIADGQMMDMASADTQTEDAIQDGEDSEEEYSYTNGRLEIFRLYYNNLNKVGHEDMGIMEPNGHYNVHAHNIYLQAAYDHGIYVGMIFILLGVGTLVQAAVYFHRCKEDRVCAALPLALLILFAVAGLTEWIFHPCSSIAYCLLLTMAPLLIDRKKAV
ncbi:MAG: O-antigen ligase family protein, partial [Lachnospiraceae bacterium]|nr:O-antigen ligase family protein [Lachnospiraceae bacterium]